MIEHQEPFGRRLYRRAMPLAGLPDGESALAGPCRADFEVTRRRNPRCIRCLYHSPRVLVPRAFL